MRIFVSLAFILLCSSLQGDERTVIRLDEVYIEGSVRRPPVTDLQGSQLTDKIQASALNNLIRLEKRLLKPISLKEYSSQKHSH